MNKKPNTRRALVLSCLSLLLCISMLIGSTFAWFTDNATAGVDAIKAGTLDIQIQDMNGDEIKDGKLTFAKAADAPVDEAILFEPGATYALSEAQIANVGDLDVKFKVVVNGLTGENAKLADVLEVMLPNADGKLESRGILSALNADSDGIAHGTLEAGGKAPLKGLALHMLESANNDYQGLTLDAISLTVYATQAASEYDSFNNTYDEKATFDEEVIVTTEELQKALNAAADAGSDDGVIELNANMRLASGETWTPIEVDGYHGAGVVTVKGNGHTIYGLNAPLFAGGFAGSSGIVIEGLTIADSNIVSTNTLGSGAFIETIDSMPTITMKDCHLKDSTVTGSRTGGLIGWNSGYNNVNDGPVKTYVNIENCTVTGCTITGAGTVGGIIGHAGANAWTWNTIKNCTVSGTTLTSNDDSYRVGAIVGTANVGEVEITNCSSTNNTIKQNNNGTEIARPEGQSELYGRFVPGNTGKLTIDGYSIS